MPFGAIILYEQTVRWNCEACNANQCDIYVIRLALFGRNMLMKYDSRPYRVKCENDYNILNDYEFHKVRLVFKRLAAEIVFLCTSCHLSETASLVSSQYGRHTQILSIYFCSICAEKRGWPSWIFSGPHPLGNEYLIPFCININPSKHSILMRPLFKPESSAVTLERQRCPSRQTQTQPDKHTQRLWRTTFFYSTVSLLSADEHKGWEISIKERGEAE